MTSMIFLINDTSTGGATPAVQITITENSDGTLTFGVTQLAGYVGDLRGLFFDLADESLIGTLTAAAMMGLTEIRQGDDTIKDLGDGANMQGLLGDNGGYDVGIEIGTSGIGKLDDYRTFTFTLDSSARDLTIADFSNVSFGARITSVGLDANLDGIFETSRSGSAKIGETTFTVVSPTDESVTVAEDMVVSDLTSGSFNLLANDGASASDVLTITAWTGGAVGAVAAPATLHGATVELNANGSWTVDTSEADTLAEGETATETFTYTIQQTNVDGTSVQTATFTVTVTGTNDAPVIVVNAGADAGSVIEDTTFTTSGQFSATDIDHDATATWSIDGSGVGTYGSIAVDGTGKWTYTLDYDAAQSLAEGQTVDETFTVVVTDDKGATASQAVKITVTGTNDAPVIVVEDGADAGSVQEDTTFTTSGKFSSTDIDYDATSTWSIDGSATGTYGSIAVDSNGQWTYTLDNSAAQGLAQGQTKVENFTVRVADEFGASVSKSVAITITGTNDYPNIQLVTTDSAATALTETNAGLTASGTLTVTDADLSDTVSSTVTGVTLTGTTGSLTDAAVQGMLVLTPSSGLAANSGDAHNLTWNFNSGTQAFDFLNVGQSLTLTYTVASSDGLANGTQTIAITIDGTADGLVAAPVVYTATGDANDFDTIDSANVATSAVTFTGSGNNQDAVHGSNVADNIAGNGGIDTIYGNGGDDTLSGGAQNDSIYGGTGNDSISGGDQNDKLYGGSGADTINGNELQDDIYGGSGNDVINGNGGNDLIVGGYGADTLTGGDGTDTFMFLSLNDTGDRITDFAIGADTIDLSAIYSGTFGFVDADATTLQAYKVIFHYDSSTGQTIIQADTDGNINTAEFQIQMVGDKLLTASDFVL